MTITIDLLAIRKSLQTRSYNIIMSRLTSYVCMYICSYVCMYIRSNYCKHENRWQIREEGHWTPVKLIMIVKYKYRIPRLTKQIL